MRPPKCRSCGKEEWRHVCGGIPESVTLAVTKPRVTKPVVSAVGGRPKVHGSQAEKQAAYRARKKVAQ